MADGSESVNIGLQEHEQQTDNGPPPKLASKSSNDMDKSGSNDPMQEEPEKTANAASSRLSSNSSDDKNRNEEDLMKEQPEKTTNAPTSNRSSRGLDDNDRSEENLKMQDQTEKRDNTPLENCANNSKSTNINKRPSTVTPSIPSKKSKSERIKARLSTTPEWDKARFNSSDKTATSEAYFREKYRNRKVFSD